MRGPSPLALAPALARRDPLTTVYGIPFTAHAPRPMPPRTLDKTAPPCLPQSMAGSLDHRLAQRRQQSREAHRPTTPRPGRPIHLHHESPARKRRAEQQDFQILISSVILDRNSQLCFHNHTEAELLTEVNRARGRARSES